MGVPVITLAGRTAVGRGGSEHPLEPGSTELIARAPEHYVAIARQWSGDLSGLSELRAGLRQRMQASPLTDGKQYAADVEAAFRRDVAHLVQPMNQGPIRVVARSRA